MISAAGNSFVFFTLEGWKIFSRTTKECREKITRRGFKIFFSLEGSSARYNEDWIITAGHNYNINKIIKNEENQKRLDFIRQF